MYYFLRTYGPHEAAFSRRLESTAPFILLSECHRHVQYGDSANLVTLAQKHLPKFSFANSDRVFEHRLKYWFQITRR